MYKILVTGGTKGIGAGVAERLRTAGHEVITCARGRDATIRCDVTVALQVEQMRDAIGPVDVLINNAGGVRTAPLIKMSESDWDWHFQLNVKSVFLCTKAFLPSMLKKGFGRVINIASTAGKIGAPYISAYAATKHAVLGLTRSLALEVADKGVTVNALCPSFVDTPMLQESAEIISRKTGKPVEELLEAYRIRNPQKRFVTIGEVASAAQFLIENSAVNGQALSLCGGETFS